jgi:hypothetical protein
MTTLVKMNLRAPSRSLFLSTFLLSLAACSSVPQIVQDQAKAECAKIDSSWQRAKCMGSYERGWKREQEIDAALKDCRKYWPEDQKMEIAKCVDKKVNRSSSRSGNSAAALAICTALSGGNAASCAAGVAKGSSDTQRDKASDRVRELEEELERKQQKFSQDCLFSGGVAVGDTCLNRGR